MSLIVAGHISQEPRKWQYMLELYDKQLIEAMSIHPCFSKQEKHIVCSPGVFQEDWRDKYGLVYKSITDHPVFAHEYLEKQYMKYDNIFLISDVGCNQIITTAMKLKNLFVFNTATMEDELTWQEFQQLNWDTIDIYNAKLSITRFIEEPYRFYVFGPNHMSVTRYGINSIVELLASYVNPSAKVEIQLYEKEKFPSDEQVGLYNEARKILSEEAPPWMDQWQTDILIHDKQTQELLCSAVIDNSTFAIIANDTRGTKSGKVCASYEVSKDIIKYNTIMQWAKNGNYLFHWDAEENYLNTQYVIAHQLAHSVPNKEQIKEMLDCVKPFEHQNYYLIYEEGHGYYIIAKDTCSILQAFRGIRLMYKPNCWNIQHIDEDDLNELILSGHTSSFYSSTIGTEIDLKKSPIILDLESIGADLMDKSSLPKTNVFYHSPFYKKHSCQYAGIHNPHMKYDLIIIWGSYPLIGLSLREVKAHFEWLYSLLTKDGKIIITGLPMFEDVSPSEHKYYINRSAIGYQQIQYQPSAHYLTKRTAIISNNKTEAIAPWSPVTEAVINTAKEIGLKVKHSCYNKKTDMHVFIFSKEAMKDGSNTPNGSGSSEDISAEPEK